MQELASSRIVTLRQVWADYQQSRDLKPATLRNYNQRLNQYLADWLDIDITLITKDMIEKRHRSIPGKAMANSTFRTLRALLHYAHFKYELQDGQPILKANPVRRLSELRAWHRDKRRTTHIEPARFRLWFRTVYSLSNTTIRDFLLLVVFMGLRKSEAINLRWEHVDLTIGTIRLFDTKNGTDVTLPMSTFVWSLLCERHVGATTPWVFPSRSPHKPFSAAFSMYEDVCRSYGHFSIHDLRRTFATFADECDLKNQVIKALLNHISGDVTEGYIQRNTERLRRATQKVTDFMLETAGIKIVAKAARTDTPT